MCHDAVRKSMRQGPQAHDQNVFEVVWLREVKPLTKVRSKWVQDMKGGAVKEQHIAHGARDDVFAGTPPLARLLKHCWHWQPAETRKKPGASCFFDTTAAVVSSPVDDSSFSFLPAGTVQPGQRILLRRGLYGTCFVSKL